jgi:flagellar basal body rod protein FlgG
MFLNPALGAALDRIAERAGDVRRAYTPGAQPARDDVAIESPGSAFTLDPLSVSSSDGAYFVTADARGGYAYTRNGSFHLAGGALVGQNGGAVYGMRADGSLGELRVDPVDAALGRAIGARVEADGTFVYERAAIDPRSGRRETQRVVAGRVALARFPAGTRLESADGDAFAAPAGTVAHVGVAGDGTFAALRPHQRQRSGVDLDESLVRLKEAYVAFDALQAAQSAKGHTAKTAMDLLK